MSIRTQLMIVVLLSMFVATPLLAYTLGDMATIANLIITVSLIVKYWKDI